MLFPYKLVGDRHELFSTAEMKRKFPSAWRYLVANKKLLEDREHGKFSESGWWQLYPKNLDQWEKPKVMLPYMITRLAAFYDDDNNFFVNVTTGCFGLTLKGTNKSSKYVTALRLLAVWRGMD